MSFSEDNFFNNKGTESRNTHTEFKSLMLFKDEWHDYKFFIDALIEVCDYDPVQSEQCAFITYYNGKCQIKIGDISQLEKVKKKLEKKGLKLSIE